MSASPSIADPRPTRPAAPWGTLGLLGGALAVALAGDGALAALLHQREDLATGRWWTPWTAHFVHFSFSHLLWDCLAVGVLGCLLERATGARRMVLGILLAAPVITLGVMAIGRDLAGYGGFSGLACALAGGLVAVWGRDGERRLAAILGLALAAKVTWECLHPGAALLVSTREEVIPVASAHALGASAGFLLGRVGFRPSRSSAERRSVAGSGG